jgi:hypothetical protein
MGLLLALRMRRRQMPENGTMRIFGV